MRVVILGLSITSSWGNGHATNYRALVSELARRGHEVLFCERDVPWYAAHRDLPELSAGELCLYGELDELQRQAAESVAGADLVIQGSYVPDGAAVADWMLDTAGGMTAFYDIDTPITLEMLDGGEHTYLTPEQVTRFDTYLSFTGGPTLERLRSEFGARRPLWFPCLVDPRVYRPRDVAPRHLLGYLGTHSDDRLPGVQSLLLEPAQRRPRSRFVLAGSGYPPELSWPKNVERIEHLAPPDLPGFYADQRFTLNITRERMRDAGFSPSVRLFEAAACGTPIISDRWSGLEQVLVPGEEILVADDTGEMLEILETVDEERRRDIADRARRRVLAEHTAARRVEQLESEVARVGAGA